MAKLGSYYGLCPLIDHRSLLGIAEDKNNGQVIVTLGKNIAIKYKLSDQKQLHSWRTKDKFTSLIVYDKDSMKYVAVFNQMFLRMWDDEEEHLDKLKKYKFSKPIYTLLSYVGKTYVIFQNGAVLSLNEALQQRKNEIEDVITCGTDFIIDIMPGLLHDVVYIGLMINSNEEILFMWNMFTDDGHKQSNKVVVKQKSNISLIGQVLSQRSSDVMQLLTLWSDGKLYSYALQNTEFGEASEPPGNTLAVIESFDFKFPVTMAALDHHYIAMYGGDCNQEGAVLIIYNIEFRVIQAKQTFKMFSSGAKVWQIENNLLISVGQNLAVIPFHLDTEQLSALVGSHWVDTTEESDMTVVQALEIANWDSNDIITDKNCVIPANIKSQVLELSEQGWPETMICKQLIPKYIENKAVDSVLCCLKYFCDIPELCIVQLVQFCLAVESDKFKNASSIDTDKAPNLQKCDFLDKILSISFSDVLLVPRVRSILNVNESLILLQYIIYLMYEDGYCLPLLNVTQSQQKLIEWGCVILDANYQKFLLSKDAHILIICTNFRKIVLDHLTCLNNLNDALPVLNQLASKKLLNKNKHRASLKYSVERVSLY